MKEHHRIHLNVLNQSIMLRIGRDMATCVLTLSPSNLCILVSVHNFDSLANFKPFIAHISNGLRHTWPTLHICKYFMVIFYVIWLKFISS